MILMCSLSDRTVIVGVFSLTTRSGIEVVRSDIDAVSWLPDSKHLRRSERVLSRKLGARLEIFPAWRT
jgi:hypothetical protein